MRRVVGYVLLVLLLVAVAICGYAWHLVHRALPQVEGTIALGELQAEVTVTRDVRGVPHLRAQNMTDLAFAQGYVMAQDRLWQMDVLRRIAAGELSEIFGASLVETDRYFRTLGFRDAAERDAETAPPEFREQAEAYARGVNRFIEDHRGNLPLEFSLLRYEPRPWRVADSLLIVGYMYETLTSSWRWDLSRARVAPKLGVERAEYFYDQTSDWDRPIVGNGPAYAGEHDRANQSSRSSGNSGDRQPLATVLPRNEVSEDRAQNDLWTVAHGMLEQFGEDVRAGMGSNNWVVSGKWTASGKPLLANDTHLSLGMPDIWYTVQLAAPGFAAEGFALPGAPGIIIGHNDRIAWGFTNDGADVQDLYAETFNPANPKQYQVNGQWQEAQVRKEIVHVKGAADSEFEVVVTRHGPILERDGNTGYALKWTATQPGGLNHSYFNLAGAQNWEEFRTRMHDASGPAQNAVYADVDGHIGFIVAARIPIRDCKNWRPAEMGLPASTPCGAAPFPGNTDDFEWQGYIPFEELPQIFDPDGGIIATANAAVVGPLYPHYITSGWAPPWRTMRIFRLLAVAGKKFTPKDFAEIQGDLVSEIDSFVAKAIVKASSSAQPHDSRTGQLVAKLANWDGSMTADSVEATFVEQTVFAIERNLLRPYLGEHGVSYPSVDVFLDRVLRDRPAMWLPKEFHNYDELLIASADTAVAELSTQMGNDTAKWKWGDRNALFIPHPIGQSGVLARIFSIGPMPQNGAHDVIKAAGRSFGPAMRMVADLSNWDNSYMEIVTGESGELGSDHYRDQFAAWFAVQPLPAPYSDAAVTKAAAHTLRFVPTPH